MVLPHWAEIRLCSQAASGSRSLGNFVAFKSENETWVVVYLERRGYFVKLGFTVLYCFKYKIESDHRYENKPWNLL